MNRRSITLAWQIATPIMLLHFPCASAANVLPDHDNGVLTGIFGFPESTEGSETIGRGQHGWDNSLIIANHNIDETGGGEELRLDGETTRLAFTYRHGLSDRLDISIEVPYLWHQSGNLDSIIAGWHDFWGFPDSGPRATRQQDQLEFFYADSQAALVGVTNHANGIGDIR